MLCLLVTYPSDESVESSKDAEATYKLYWSKSQKLTETYIESFKESQEEIIHITVTWEPKSHNYAVRNTGEYGCVLHKIIIYYNKSQAPLVLLAATFQFVLLYLCN